MALTYSATTKTARMNAVVTAIGTSGLLKMWTTSGGTLLATFPLAATAGTVSGNVLTFSDANGGTAGIMSVAAAATGTATYAEIQTSAGVAVITGLTVGTAATDIIIDNPSFVATQVITINTGTITHS
jgi:hypothetical protein